MMHLVTVIVPVYNVEKYLRECVDSILKQTYANLEVILVDDGSKDESGAICDMYATADFRVKVIHKANGGLGFARNSGLEVASGKYVTFVDSDDFVDADMVERLMQGILENHADTCIGGFKRIREDGTEEFREQYDSEVFRESTVYDSLFARMLGSSPEKRDSIRMSVWNVLYSMDIIREHKLQFLSEREILSEDIIWDSEYYRYAKSVCVIPSAAYAYRITPGSLTQKYRPDRFSLSCRLYHEVADRVGQEKSKITRLQRLFFVYLRVCIRQERKSVSGKTFAQIRNALRQIVNDSTVVEILREYPIHEITWKARVFLLMVKYRAVLLLQLCLRWNLV